MNAIRSIGRWCLFALLCTSCKDLGSGPAPDSFAIYRLADPSIGASAAWTVPLGDLVLEPSPFIRANDLKSYRWSTHEFVPSPALNTVLEAMAMKPGMSRGVPFVVVVGKERIYLGSFWWAYSSLMPQVPYIDVTIEVASSGSYAIQPAPLSSGADPRQDIRVRESLSAAGILVD